MVGPVDWRLRLRTSESKSLGIDTGNSVMMSSYDGWREHSLPKLLIIWRFDKKRSSVPAASHILPLRYQEHLVVVASL